MDHGFRFIWKSLIDTRRLLWIMVLTFAAVLLVQFFELPRDSVLSSLLSAGKVAFFGKRNFPDKGLSSNFGTVGNITDTNTIQEITNSAKNLNLTKEGFEENEGKYDRSKVDCFLNKNASMDKEFTSVNTGCSLRDSVGKCRDFEHTISSRNVTEKNDTSPGNIQTQYVSSTPGQNESSGSASECLLAFSSPNPVSPTKLDSVTPVISVEPNSSPVLKMPPEDNISMVNNTSSMTPSPSHGRSEMPKLASVTISKMNELLLQSHSLPSSTPPQWISTGDKELLHAKSEIENASSIDYDSGLYEPLYRNVFMFKRSYDLMDKMLRIYIYKEGEKPIFHESILEGIYASEGWFLKLLESSKQFVTEDPKEAHLFYIPFSSRLLELTLYVRHSHSRKNLIAYIQNYVEMLIQKYPFWNRTNGEDHFLAACHDWAPAETRGRMLSCLRALCNADINTGFVIGKDVSLPTVNVRSAKNPLKDIGGEPAIKRPVLAFFAGYMHGRARPTLLKYWGKDPDMRIFDRLPHVKGNKNYIEHMKSSKYCICARGFAVHSPRVVESIFFECVPVIISDNYVPPFFEVLNWESFAIFVLEKDIPNLKSILLSIPDEKYLEMLNGVKQVQKHFLWHAEPVEYDLFHMTLHSVWYNRVFRLNFA
ncbi:Exostosin family protein [Forsythia ovata]|uniref:Exostosin family protein n=1 Tax=Forsythia ovata TaxID=205694 RepID=A0ABD1W7V2_9LAMI